MEKGQGAGKKLPFHHQGHLWGRGLAAGGRRLEPASDAGEEVSSAGDGVMYAPPFITAVTGVSRDVC